MAQERTPHVNSIVISHAQACVIPNSIHHAPIKMGLVTELSRLNKTFGNDIRCIAGL